MKLSDVLEKRQPSQAKTKHTAWCDEIASLTSLTHVIQVHPVHVREPILLHQAAEAVQSRCPFYTLINFEEI